MRAREGAGIRAELDRLFKTLGDAEPTTSDASPSTPPVSSLFAPTPFSLTAPPRPRKRTTGAAKKPAPVARRLFAAKKSPLRKTKAGGVTKRTTPKRAAKALPLDDVSDAVSTVSSSASTPPPSPTPSLASTRRRSATKTKKDSGSRTKRVARETVSNSHAKLLRHFNWSGWKQAFTDSAPPRSSKLWKARQGGHVGFRNTNMFANTDHAALYELAAQTHDDHTPKAVWLGYTSGFNSHNWDTHLLTSQLQDNIDAVLRRGATVFVRRATQLKSSFTHNADVISTFDDARKLLRDTFDYAWAGKTSPRRELFLRRSRRAAVVTRRGVSYY